MSRPYLSIIIPAYNEAKRLPITLIDIDRHLAKVDFSYEILVVNDGSTDTTAELVRRLEPLINNLKLIDNLENRGKGAVVKQGMLIAKGNYRLFMDADNSTAIIEFHKMTPYFQEGYDVIIGSRRVLGAQMKPSQPFLKMFLGMLGNYWIQLWVLRGIQDTQAGFKCFSAEAAENIFSKLHEERWAFDIEALALARLLGYHVKEIPIFWVNDLRTHVKSSAYLQVLWQTVKIWWRLRRIK